MCVYMGHSFGSCQSRAATNLPGPGRLVQAGPATPQLAPDPVPRLWLGLLHPALLPGVRYACCLWYCGLCGPMDDKYCPVSLASLAPSRKVSPPLGWLCVLWDTACPLYSSGSPVASQLLLARETCPLRGSTYRRTCHKPEVRHLAIHSGPSLYGAYVQSRVSNAVHP